MDQCKYHYEPSAAHPVSVAIGIILVLGTPLSIVPAHVKVLSKRSCEGISPTTVLLTNVAVLCLVWNMMLLKFPQMKSCPSQWWLCQANMLAFYQQTIQLLLFYPLYYWCSYFAEEEGKKQRLRKAWLAQVGLLFFGTGGLILWSWLGDCSFGLRLVASSLGYFAALLNGVRQIPQVRTSLYMKGSGSISYVFYVLMSIGGILNLYFQIESSKERLTTLLATGVGCVMILAVLVLCAYYDCRRALSQQRQDGAGSSLL